MILVRGGKRFTFIFFLQYERFWSYYNKMIVTDTTLSGYTVINGSWGLQMGLLVGALYNYFMYPSDKVYGYTTDLQPLIEFDR